MRVITLLGLARLGLAYVLFCKFAIIIVDGPSAASCSHWGHSSPKNKKLPRLIAKNTNKNTESQY